MAGLGGASEPSSASSSAAATGTVRDPNDKSSPLTEFIACGQNHSELPRRTVNLIILDYLLKQGFATAALSFVKEAGLDGIDISSVIDDYPDERVQIRNHIIKGEITKAVELINEYFPTFFDESPSIHMDLLHLVLVELIRQGKSDDALTFAQEIVSKQNIEEHGGMDRYERTMALLAYEKPEESPFRDMLDDDLRRSAAVRVSNALLEAQGIDSRDAVTRIIKLNAFLQDQLSKDKVVFPRIVDYATGALSTGNETKCSDNNC